MVADKEASSLSTVYSYYSNYCNLPFFLVQPAYTRFLGGEQENNLIIVHLQHW